MKTLEITRETTGWIEEITARLESGDRVEVRFETPAVSPQEMADRIGLSRTAIMRWIERGEIKADRRGSHYRIPVREVDRFRTWYFRRSAQLLAQDW